MYRSHAERRAGLKHVWSVREASILARQAASKIPARHFESGAALGGLIPPPSDIFPGAPNYQSRSTPPTLDLCQRPSWYRSWESLLFLLSYLFAYLPTSRATWVTRVARSWTISSKAPTVRTSAVMSKARRGSFRRDPVKLSRCQVSERSLTRLRSR